MTDKHYACVDNMCKVASLVSDDLFYMANGFRIVGNKTVSEQLTRMANLLKDEEHKLRVFIYDHVHNQAKQSEQATKNMMEALKAGMEIGNSKVNNNV